MSPVRPLIAALAVVVVSGCANSAAMHTKGTAMSDTRAPCTVRLPGLLVDAVARVDGNSARIPGLLADRVMGVLEADGRIVTPALLGNMEGGTFKDDVLTVRVLFGELKTKPISGDEVILQGLLLDQRFAADEVCTNAEAALGVYALVKYQEENNLLAAGS